MNEMLQISLLEFTFYIWSSSKYWTPRHFVKLGFARPCLSYLWQTIWRRPLALKSKRKRVADNVPFINKMSVVTSLMASFLPDICRLCCYCDLQQKTRLKTLVIRARQYCKMEKNEIKKCKCKWTKLKKGQIAWSLLC